MINYLLNGIVDIIYIIIRTNTHTHKDRTELHKIQPHTHKSVGYSIRDIIALSLEKKRQSENVFKKSKLMIHLPKIKVKL